MKKHFHPLSAISGIFPSHSKKGLEPGSLLHTGKKKMEKVNIQLLEYDEKNSTEKDISEKKLPDLSKNKLQWLNISGLHDTKLLERIGKKYGLHSLLLEDILNTNGRPKLDEIEDVILIVVKILKYDEKNDNLNIEQISIIFGKGFVLSFQEQHCDALDGVKDRIRSGKTRMRLKSADYLAYALLDAIVDSYLDTMQRIGERMHALETELIEDPTNDTRESIYALKREMLLIQQAVWPLDEIIRHMQRTDSKLINKKKMEPFLGDLEDHANQVEETIKTFRMMVAGMQDTYMSIISNRMNEIMKTLTLMASIFIPLTFIVGIYGMNFKNMPELEWEYGYLMVIGVLVAVSISLIAYFRKKRWL